MCADGQIYRDHPTVSPAQVQGKTIWEAFPPEICAEFEPLMRSTFAGRKEEAEMAFEGQMLKVATAPIKDARGRVINPRHHGTQANTARTRGALEQVAAVLGEAVNRPGDLLARYGGEEMAVLLPSPDLDGALHVAQRIHALLAERAIPFDASLVAGHVTVSIGAASIVPSPQEKSSILIKKADEALYAAKANGRNRTESDKALEGSADQTRHRETPEPA